MKEKPYSVREVAALTGLSRQTIQRLFEREPGTLILARPECLHKRSYRTIRIPHHVYERVTGRMAVK